SYVLYVRHEGRNMRGSPKIEFLPRQKPEVVKRPKPEGIVWPTYGYDAQRQHVAPPFRLRPPFRRLWTFHGQARLEFPPAVAYGRLYLPTFDGRFFALDAKTGKAIWRYTSHRCAWASPAVAGRLVYQTFIGRACNDRVPGTDGTVVAFDAQSGKIR